MKRGQIIRVALSGDYGKPRPAVLIQADAFMEAHPSIVVCPVTSELRDTPLFRITLEPSRRNGLQKLSQIMVDKVQATRRERIGDPIGELEEEYLIRLNRSLMVFLGLP